MEMSFLPCYNNVIDQYMAIDAKDFPTYPYIRKNRAIALIRLLTQPFFAHLWVGC